MTDRLDPPSVPLANYAWDNLYEARLSIERHRNEEAIRNFEAKSRIYVREMRKLCGLPREPGVVQ